MKLHHQQKQQSMNDGARLAQVQCDTIKQTEEKLKTDLLPVFNITNQPYDTTLNSHIQVAWSFLWYYLTRKLTLRDLYKSFEMVKCDITFNIAKNKVDNIGGHGVVPNNCNSIKMKRLKTHKYLHVHTRQNSCYFRKQTTNRKVRSLCSSQYIQALFFWRLG